jgi:hypothetical protein
MAPPYDAYGNGPTVILIGGASQHGAIDQRTTEIAKHLAAEGFTTVDYDRRGRDRSGDTPPWSLETRPSPDRPRPPTPPTPHCLTPSGAYSLAKTHGPTPEAIVPELVGFAVDHLGTDKVR